MAVIAKTDHFMVNDTGASYEVKYLHSNKFWGLYQRLDNRELAVEFIKELEANLEWDARLRGMLGVPD